MTIFIKHKVKILYLNSDTDVNLANFIASEGITQGDVTVIIPEGEIIGNVTANYALNVGDITHLGEITLIVQGEIQGAGGDQNLLDGRSGIYSVYPLTIQVDSTGAIRAGGGAGGLGGLGFAGEYAPRKAETRSYSRGYNQYGFGADQDLPQYGVYWDGGYKGIGSGFGRIHGGYKYTVDDNPSIEGPSMYAPARGKIVQYPAGAGGIGGPGQGYNIDLIEDPTALEGEAGLPGFPPPSGNGVGGTGGTGGTWGEPGSPGAEGARANYYNYSNAQNLWGYGEPGEEGGQSGHSVYAYEGSQTGVIVINNGTMQGRTYY